MGRGVGAGGRLAVLRHGGRRGREARVWAIRGSRRVQRRGLLAAEGRVGVGTLRVVAERRGARRVAAVSLEGGRGEVRVEQRIGVGLDVGRHGRGRGRSRGLVQRMAALCLQHSMRRGPMRKPCPVGAAGQGSSSCDTGVAVRW